MIHRFSVKSREVGRTVEVQLLDPAGTPVEKLAQAVRRSLAEQGLGFATLQYLGSVDTNFEGIVLPARAKCAAEGCDNSVDTPGEFCKKCGTWTIHGWYTPNEKTRARNRCSVEGCDGEASFHLCNKHAIPGAVVGNRSGRMFVIGAWLVERAGRVSLITLNDYSLGVHFGRPEALERQLGKQGYKVRSLISSQEELEAAKQRHPGLRIMLWSPNLPDGEDELPELL